MERPTRPKICWNVVRLAADMALHGWNEAALAREAGIHGRTVTRFLSEHTQTPKTAAKLAKALGHPVDRYLSHVEGARRGSGGPADQPVPVGDTVR